MALDQLNEQIYNCRRCRLWQGAKHAVPGEGPLDAKVMIVGQNPGAAEDEAGRPFVGRTGKFLNKVLAEHGIKRESLFITNIVKHKTPNNRAPYADEIAACLPYLITQIGVIKPTKVWLMGVAARQTPRIGGIEYCELVHPSMAARFPKFRKKFLEQCRQFMRMP